MSVDFTLILAVLLIFGIFVSKMTTRLGVPVLLMFLGIGMLSGSDGLKLVEFSDMRMAGKIADIMLMFILFDSGYGTQRDDMRRYFGPAMTLATFGVALTAVSLGLLTHLLMNIGFWNAMIIGMIISSTDAAAVTAILRDNPVQTRVSTTLGVESAANDPMAILLTMAVIGIVAGQVGGASEFLLQLAWKLAAGAGCGFIVSALGVRLFNRLRSENTGFYYVLIIGVIMLAYGSATSIGASGIIGVFFAGYRLNCHDYTFKASITRFISGLSSFANMALFLMLGLLVFPQQLPAVWLEGTLVALAMIFVARPLAVWLCLMPFGYRSNEKAFITWGGLKGSVAIVLATYPALYGGDYFTGELSQRIFNIVFFAVVFSCVLEGLTLDRVAAWLKLKVTRKAKRMHSLELLSLEETDAEMYEVEMPATAAVIGKNLSELTFPAHSRVVLLIRNEEVITPTGATRLLADDMVFVLTNPQEKENTNRLLTAAAATIGRKTVILQR
ncbi:K+/H+ antiporter [Planctomycetales bacterium]|nr:K+/H+ antiporter [Planctomycetales bacterium]